MEFPVSYTEVINRITAIDPVAYAQNRNYINGQVSYLSPYISRGVISTRQVLESLLEKGHTRQATTKLIQQLAWREYFQRTWQHLGDDLYNDILHRYTGVKHNKMPAAVLNAETGIRSVDQAIADLYQTGYMHNHLRLYVASISCNIAKADWQLPAQWMYYHLLDGDIASNICSWQWVTGHFSSRQYFCNQENINKYTGSDQHHSFLDKSYEELPEMEIPEVLRPITDLQIQTALPPKTTPDLDSSLPLVLYTSYNLDPAWKQEIAANRLLVLEPSHFKQFPVSQKVIDFIISLAGNIKGLQLFVGEINGIPGLQQFPEIYSKEHPLTNHFPGIREERDWLFPEIDGYYNSFFKYWRQCEKIWNKKNPDQVLQLLRNAS